jgi:hypothetical protein
MFEHSSNVSLLVEDIVFSNAANFCSAASSLARMVLKLSRKADRGSGVATVVSLSKRIY